MGTIREIARREHLDGSDVGRFLPLAFLAPDVVETIVAGKQPSGLTTLALRRASPVPSNWDAQRRALRVLR